MNPQTYIDKGFIDVSDDAAFRTMAEAASCFGKKYIGLQQSYIPHPVERGKRLWFPKFYENAAWSNNISEDESIITESSKIPERRQEHINRVLAESTESRLVFARVKGPLGELMYRFKGEFKLDRESTSYESGLMHRRISTRANTYPQENANRVSSNSLTASSLYGETVKEMPIEERLKLAAMILNDVVN